LRLSVASVIKTIINSGGNHEEISRWGSATACNLLTGEYMSMHSKIGILAAVAVFFGAGAQAQQAAPGAPANAGRAGGGGRPVVGPMVTEHFRSSFVKLGGTAADALMYEPVAPAANPRVAVLYSNSNFNFDPPAADLASRGYRVLFVRHPARPGEIPTPFDGFEEASKGITYLRSLPGVQRVVVAGWGSGAVTMTLYADVAAHGPAACQGKQIISPCTREQASGLAKPDGVILFDPGLGSGSKISNVDPAYEGDNRSKRDLDMFTAANGYDAKTGTAKYSADFRKRYFAAQAARNNKIIDDAIARLKVLGQGDEPLLVPGGVNNSDLASLHHTDLSIISHTKKPYTLLKADGSKPQVILQSIRTTTAPLGEEALAKMLSQNGRVARGNYTLRQFLANDAIRTTKDFALTDDDVLGVDWKSSNTGTPYQAEGISVPALVMTNTCFQFVIASEIVYDHLASKDKTFAGVEGSEHFFTPCGPQYGDTRMRLFDFVSSWLGKPGRF
jgi:hypothetical protein